MRAVTWQGPRDVRVETVADPQIQQTTDAVIKVTSSGICGSDLHLYEVLAPFMAAGDILGHEPMGIVEEVGSEVTSIKPGDRVVIPFQISCGSCFMCDRGLNTQCETTQMTEKGMGAPLFGYTELYGSVPGAQAEYLRVPQAHYGPIVVPEGPPDDRFVYLSDVLPTAYQAIEYAGTRAGDSLVVLGLGPIGDMACRLAHHRGARVIGVDPVPERRARLAARGIETLDPAEVDSVGETVHELTSGRGADATVDAVGMEAHGSRSVELVHKVVGLLPDSVAKPMMLKAGVDRLAALHDAIETTRRGGTVSISGVYGGAADPMPLLRMFDKQLTFRMGQANVKRWVDDLLPLLGDEDPLGVEDFATHHISLDEAPDYYEKFQKKTDGVVKAVIRP
ncbi:MAG: zinc-dependent alcohol dehydrogenase [Nocardioides sp.]|nr:zinc-dependent alcohol dehydrogenase [Nocardioides sp.]